MGYKTNIYANKHFSSVSFVTKLIAVEGAYLNQHFGASCKLQNVKRSKNPKACKLVTANNWPGKIKRRSWQQKVDSSVCLPPCWEEKFFDKEFGGRRERADWPAAAPKQTPKSVKTLATSLRILSVKTIITAKRIFNQFGCSSSGTLGQRCWLWPEGHTLSITTAGLGNGITSTLYVNHDLSFWPFTF